MPTPQQARAELARREISRRTQSKPVVTGEDFPGETFVKALSPAYNIAKPIVKGYGNLRKGVSEFVSSPFPEGGTEYPVSVPNPMFPVTQIPMGKFTGKEAAGELGGMALDQLTTLGLVKGVPGMAKGVDKTITSLLRRIGGKTSGDIKSTRILARGPKEFNPFSKTKSKPAYLGREISPKATELASSRVRSMEPESMREIGIGSEDTALAQELKSKFGLSEFPTKSSADEFYAQTMKAVPEETEFPTARFEQALSDPSNRLDSRSTEYIKSILNRTRGNELGVIEKRPLLKQDYENIRGLLNNLDPSGETPAVQAIKQALDADAGDIIPALAEAKGRFQLSRQVPKAELYLDKTKLPEEISRRLKSGSVPENVDVRESLKRLLGEGSEPILKDLEAQRLSKEWYGGIGEGPGVSGRPILDVIKNLLRPLPRGYEKGRAGVVNIFKGRKPSIPISSQATSKPSSISTQNTPTPKPTPKPSGISMQEIAERVRNYKTPDIPSNPIAIATAQEQAMMEAVARGEFWYSGPPIYAPHEPYPGIPYKDPGPMRETGKKMKDLAKRRKRA